MEYLVYVCVKVCQNCLVKYSCPFAIPHLHVACFDLRHVCPISADVVKCEIYTLSVNFKEAEYSYGREFGKTEKGV